jgi:hypothetical protein
MVYLTHSLSNLTVYRSLYIHSIGINLAVPPYFLLKIVPVMLMCVL